MTDPIHLLSRLTDLGASVSLDGDQLILKAPRDLITPDLRKELAEHKAEITALLETAEPERLVLHGLGGQPPAQLSRSQRRIWFLDSLEPGSAIWNVASIFRVAGKLDVRALERAFSEIVSRHAVLRTTFDSVNGVPRVSIGPASGWSLSVYRFADDAKARAAAQCEAVRPFDLNSGPVFRIVLCEVNAERRYLCIAAHHIVCDGWSLGIMARELSALYQAYSYGLPYPLPRLPCQYSDYVMWESEDEERAHQTDLSWWKQKLSGPLPLIEMPADRPRPMRLSGEGRRVSLLVPLAVCGQLRLLARQCEVTVFMLLLAAFKVLLYRYTGQEDMVIGTVSSYRKRREFAQLIGMFANPVVLRTDLSGAPSFRDLLSRVRETVLTAFSRDTIPFDRLVEELRPDRELTQPPLFQISFTYQNFLRSGIHLDGVEVSQEPIEVPGARYDLSVEVWETDLGLACDFEFKTELFDLATIERLQSHYLQLLDAVVAAPDTKITQLEVLHASERAQLISGWNGASEPYPDQPIHALFEACCRRSPDAAALIDGSRAITYEELNARANLIARELQLRGIRVGATVGVLMERSAGSIAAMLAILKIGAAYLPLDTLLPKERLALLLRDAEAEFVLINSAERERTQLPQGSRYLEIAAIMRRSLKDLPENVSARVELDDLMCLLYTSGSTGAPKGVEIRHRGLARLLFSKECASFGSQEAVLHMAPQSFDASLLEIWGPLVHGGACVIYSGRQPNITVLAALLKQHKVATAWLTASVFNWIVDEAPETLAPLRQIYTGGEALSPLHVRRARQLLPHVSIINGYGPTEATTFSCIYRIPRDLREDLASIPIGRAISNTKVYVLDSNRQLSPIGVPGELYIGGDALARGYRNRPGLTSEKFVPDHFAGIGHLYRSGDLAAYLPDGNLRFVGRTDHQVKVRGHRIELEEIETAVAEYPGVKGCSVTVQKSAGQGDSIVAWFCAHDDVRVEDVRANLKRRLPAYMLPNHFFRVDAIPLLENGKIDRAALAARPLPRNDREQSGQIDTHADLDRDLVRLIAQAMAELLDLQYVGDLDDFFALGGHSLLAMRLAARLEALLDRRVPAEMLFQASTPEAIARFLDTERTRRPHRLVPLKPTGSEPPLFLVHLMHDGHINYYLSLVRCLDGSLPAYALCLGDLDHKREGASLQDMAAVHIKHIKQARSSGPYHLCGYSSAGILAFEIAQQLKRQGDSVNLILIDTCLPKSLRCWTSTELLGAARLCFRPRNWPKLAQLACHVLALRRKDLQEAGGAFRKRSASSPVSQARKSDREIRATLKRALNSYRPQVYEGSAVLFYAKDDPYNNLFNFDGFNNLGRWFGQEIEMHPLAGSHKGIMRQPSVGIIAETLQKILSRCPAQAQTGSIPAVEAKARLL